MISKRLREIPTGSYPLGALNTGVYKNFATIATSNSLYFANDTRQRHSYYETLIGTRMRSIEWCLSNDLE